MEDGDGAVVEAPWGAWGQRCPVDAYDYRAEGGAGHWTFGQSSGPVPAQGRGRCLPAYSAWSGASSLIWMTCSGRFVPVPQNSVWHSWMNPESTAGPSSKAMLKATAW